MWLPLSELVASVIYVKPHAWNRGQKADKFSVSQLRAVCHAENTLRGPRSFAHRLARLEDKRMAQADEHLPCDFNAFHADAASVALVFDQYRNFGNRSRRLYSFVCSNSC